MAFVGFNHLPTLRKTGGLQSGSFLVVAQGVRTCGILV